MPTDNAAWKLRSFGFGLAAACGSCCYVVVSGAVLGHHPMIAGALAAFYAFGGLFGVLMGAVA